MEEDTQSWGGIIILHKHWHGSGRRGGGTYPCMVPSCHAYAAARTTPYCYVQRNHNVMRLLQLITSHYHILEHTPTAVPMSCDASTVLNRMNYYYIPEVWQYYTRPKAEWNITHTEGSNKYAIR